MIDGVGSLHNWNRTVHMFPTHSHHRRPGIWSSPSPTQWKTIHPHPSTKYHSYGLSDTSKNSLNSRCYLRPVWTLETKKELRSWFVMLPSLWILSHAVMGTSVTPNNFWNLRWKRHKSNLLLGLLVFPKTIPSFKKYILPLLKMGYLSGWDGDRLYWIDWPCSQNMCV